MMIYLLAFTSSTLLISVKNKIVKKQRWILEIIALLIPCIIAGMRASTIGTDVQRYLVQMTNAAINSDSFIQYLNSHWFMIWEYLSVSDYEIAFSCVVYIIAKLFGNIYMVQFILQLLTIGPIYFSLKVLYGSSNKFCWIGFLTFLLMFYNVSLNAMRQCIAMAFILVAFSYLTKNNLKKCIIFTIIAFLFHTSALLGVVIFFVYFFVEKMKPLKIKLLGKNVSYRYTNMLFFILISIVGFLSLEIIISLLNIFGLSKYLNYINGSISFMPNQIISRLPSIFMYFYALKKYVTEKNIRFLFVMLFLDLISSQFTSVSEFGGRISMYFSQFQILGIPAICERSNHGKLISTIFVLYLFFYWWFYFVYIGANSTVPYILGL